MKICYFSAKMKTTQQSPLCASIARYGGSTPPASSPSPAAVHPPPPPPPSAATPSPSVALLPSFDLAPQPSRNGAVLNRLGFAAAAAGFVAVTFMA
ncbi:hypothetical protein DH2020_044832 [Rehmannia glutinosa]|uniref:Uncharacterized protein n=1 Tax=Rehmannia glutinosa TaxID=99300 RepID=A0ABR0UFW1_REHGL